jgi:Ras family protein T1
MQEFGEGPAENLFEDNKKKLAPADVLCFVYDSSDMRSFAYIAQLMTDVRNSFLVSTQVQTLLKNKKFDDYQFRQEISSIPCCIVATKRDLDLVEQVLLLSLFVIAALCFSVFLFFSYFSSFLSEM